MSAEAPPSWFRPPQPFEPGNERALRHGAESPRRWRPLADRIAAGVVDVAPWCARPAFTGAVAAWSRAEAQVALVVEWLDEHGILDEKGEPRSAATYLLRLEAAAANRRAELGLNPSAFAKLLAMTEGRPAAASEREALLAEARELVEARAS